MKQSTRRMISFTAIVLGFFMALLDATIVNIALPQMAKFYGVEMESVSWIVNGYNLAFAVFILVGSRLADQFGRKKIFILGIGLFTFASLAAGFAPSIAALIAIRVIQGLAGAIIVPVTIPLATDHFPKESQGFIIGVWGAISGLAAASGPTLGGFLTRYFSWQSIFFVNIPLGILSIALSIFLLKESRDSTASKRIDWAGMIAISSGMFCLVYALIKANDYGWLSLPIISLFSGAILAFVAFVIIEAKGREPMLPIKLFKIPAFNWASITLLLVGFGIMSAAFLMSFFLTTVTGLSALDAGLMIAFMPLGSILFSAISGPLSSKLGSRWFAVAGMAVLCASLWLFSGMEASSTRWDAAWRLFVTGMGLGLAMSPVITSAIRNVPPEKVGMSSGFTNMTRSLGGVLGVAIIVTLLNGYLPNALGLAKERAVALVENDKRLLPELRSRLSDELKSASVSKGSTSVSADESLKKFDEATKESILAMPEEDRPGATNLMAVQRREVVKLLPKVQNEILVGVAESFSRTFAVLAIVLLIGVLVAFFSDKPGRPLPLTEERAIAAGELG